MGFGFRIQSWLSKVLRAFFENCEFNFATSQASGLVPTSNEARKAFDAHAHALDAEGDERVKSHNATFSGYQTLCRILSELPKHCCCICWYLQIHIEATKRVSSVKRYVFKSDTAVICSLGNLNMSTYNITCNRNGAFRGMFCMLKFGEARRALLS